jgi:hypothetical protein
MKKQTIGHVNAREWLKENGYSDIADMINAYIAHIKSLGSGERRNYWDLLVGRKDGECCMNHGFKFPILESVRKARRPNWKPSIHAIKRNNSEVIPAPVIQKRWNKI